MFFVFVVIDVDDLFIEVVDGYECFKVCVFEIDF